MQKNIPEYMYISRPAGPHHFWLLRFRHMGECVHRENFSDSTYKTKEKGLAAALKKRAKLAKKYGVDFETHWGGCKTKNYRYHQKKVSSRNSSGIPGVALQKLGKYTYYRASISFEIGVETTKNFNCEVLGYNEALKRAIDQRRAWEKELIKNNKVNK